MDVLSRIFLKIRTCYIIGQVQYVLSNIVYCSQKLLIVAGFIRRYAISDADTVQDRLRVTFGYEVLTMHLSICLNDNHAVLGLEHTLMVSRKKQTLLIKGQ